MSLRIALAGGIGVLVASLALGAAGAASPGGPAALRPGPLLDPGNLPVLPAQGVAVQAEESLVLAALDGRVIGRVRGLSLAYAPFELPDLVTAEDAHGRGWVLDAPARKFRPTGGRIPLAGGAEFIQSGRSRRIVRGARTLWSFAKVDFWFVSQARDLVTDLGSRASRVFDVRTAAVRPLPRGCEAAARRGGTLILLCAPAAAPRTPRTIEALSPSGSRRVLTGPPPRSKLGGEVVGFWVWAYVSPDGSKIAAEWSGECEEGTAYLLPARGGKPRPALGKSASESVALGWTAGGDVVVYVQQGGCATGAPQAGVYRIDGAGTARLVLETGESETGAALWGP